MQHIPEYLDSLDDVEEEKYAEDPSKEIALTGTEIDESKIKEQSGSQETNRCSGDSEYEDWMEDDDEEGVDERNTPQHPAVTVLGIVIPLWCSKRPVSWDRVAIGVANQAPCFCCMRLQHSTYRAVLARLIILCAGFAILQIVSGIWLYVILKSPSIVDREIVKKTASETMENQTGIPVLTNVWNLNGSVLLVSVLACVILLAIACTVRVIQNVNLAGAIRLLWIIVWVIPLQVRKRELVCVLSCACE